MSSSPLPTSSLQLVLPLICMWGISLIGHSRPSMHKQSCYEQSEKWSWNTGTERGKGMCRKDKTERDKLAGWFTHILPDEVTEPLPVQVLFRRANHHHVMLQWLVANSKINIILLASCSKGPSYQPVMSATSHNWENEDTLTPALQGHFFCAVPKQQLSPSLILCCLPLALANHAVSEHGFLWHYHVDIWPMQATLPSITAILYAGAEAQKHGPTW